MGKEKWDKWPWVGGAEEGGGLSADGGGTNDPAVAGPCNQNARNERVSDVCVRRGRERKKERERHKNIR